MVCKRAYGITTWRRFKDVINRAMESCKSAEIEVSDHFADAVKMVEIGSNAVRDVDDIMLTRYACYLIAQNGDPRKEEIAFAQSYFAVQTRKQELIGLPMYDAPNAVEELKQPRKHPTAEKVEAIKDALKHFEVI